MVTEFTQTRHQKTANHTLSASTVRFQSTDVRHQVFLTHMSKLVFLTRSMTVQNRRASTNYVKEKPTEITLTRDTVAAITLNAPVGCRFRSTNVRKVNCLTSTGRSVHFPRALNVNTFHIQAIVRLLNWDFTKTDLWNRHAANTSTAITDGKRCLDVRWERFLTVNHVLMSEYTHARTATLTRVTLRKTDTTGTTTWVVVLTFTAHQTASTRSYARMDNHLTALNVFLNGTVTPAQNIQNVLIDQMATIKSFNHLAQNISTASKVTRFRYVNFVCFFEIMTSPSSLQTLTCRNGRVFNGISCVASSSYACPGVVGHSSALKLNCVQRSCQPMCSRDGFFADYDSRCKNYHFCIGGNQTKLSCSPSFVFSETEGLCVPEEKFQCPVYCSSKCS